MKKKTIRFLIFILLVIFVPLASGSEKKKKKPVPETDLAAIERIKAKEQEARAREMLKGQEWVIYVNPMKELKAKSQIDILTFSDDIFSSKNLVSKGYKESPYTITIRNDGPAVWESIQEHPDGGMVFWRGELKGKVVQGIISMLQKGGMVEDFYFSTAVAEEKL